MFLEKLICSDAFVANNELLSTLSSSMSRHRFKLFGCLSVEVGNVSG